jgi:hypothetical protein
VAATVPRTWQGLTYRVLDDAASVRSLFDFAAVPWPPAPALGWGAFAASEGGETLVGAVVAEPAGSSLFLHGPVVVSGESPLDVAAQLASALMDHAVAAGAHTLFTRPQGLDRLWVRFGFIPVPEGALPPALAGRPGAGLYAWRGGSALWSFRDIAAG